MSVSVSPREFQYVHFDADLIGRVAATLVDALGLEVPVEIEVDETTPLARIDVELGATVRIRAQSGAFEDTRHPRHQSEQATAASLGRVLLRARDRLTGGFGEAPADDELTLAQVSAWNAYCAGRLQRLGVQINPQRFRYDFRNRHGFSDAGDRAFDRLWDADALTWAELDRISNTAATS
ncbi:MAG: hypothetical protein U0Q03_08465 [Acidimicrobiales bacterium]